MTSFIKHISILLCLCALVIPANAGDDDLRGLLLDAASVTPSDVDAARNRQVLSLFDLYALSVATTERMAIRGEEGEQARARHDAAFGAFLPQLSLKAYKTLPEPGSYNSFTPRTTVSVYARQNLITGLDEFSNFRGTAAEVRMRACLLKNEASLLLYDVASAYLYVLRVEKSLAAQEAIRRNYAAIDGELTRRVRLGRSRKGELSVIRSREYMLDAEIESLRNELSRARNALSTLSGASPNVLLAGDPVIGPPGYLDADPVALTANRYDMKALAEEVNMRRSETLQARGGHLPSVYLEGGYRLYQRNMEGQDYYAGLGATLPLFSGGITMAEVERARSAERSAELALSQGRRNAVRQISDAMTAYMGTEREVESYTRALEMARSAYRSVSAEYALSLVTLLDVLNSLTDLEEAQNALDSVVLQRVLDRVALGVATGEFHGQGMDTLRVGRALEEK